MLRILPFASLIFLFSSCTTYQYMRVSSNTIEQNENKDFVAENDSIQLRYRFDGHNAPVNLEVSNMHSKPIFIDWKRSAMIINDNAYPFKPGTLSVSGSTYTSAFNWFNQYNTSTGADFSSTVNFPGDMEFIPPGARFSESPMGITSTFHVGVPGEFRRASVPMASGYSGSVMRAEYEEENSPIRFTSYLTLLVEGDKDKRVVFQHSFYVSEIQKTSYGPHNFRFFNQRDGDHFYVSKISQGGQVVGYGILAGVLVGAAAVGLKNTGPLEY